MERQLYHQSTAMSDYVIGRLMRGGYHALSTIRENLEHCKFIFPATVLWWRASGRTNITALTRRRSAAAICGVQRLWGAAGAPFCGLTGQDG
jgi:hypothetical protein